MLVGVAGVLVGVVVAAAVVVDDQIGLAIHTQNHEAVVAFEPECLDHPYSILDPQGLQETWYFQRVFEQLGLGKLQVLGETHLRNYYRCKIESNITQEAKKKKAN